MTSHLDAIRLGLEALNEKSRLAFACAALGRALRRNGRELAIAGALDRVDEILNGIEQCVRDPGTATSQPPRREDLRFVRSFMEWDDESQPKPDPSVTSVMYALRFLLEEPTPSGLTLAVDALLSFLADQCVDVEGASSVECEQARQREDLATLSAPGGLEDLRFR